MYQYEYDIKCVYIYIYIYIENISFTRCFPSQLNKYLQKLYNIHNTIIQCFL